MTTNPVEELIIAAHMRALSIVLEGEAANSSRIFTQACVGFDPEVVGDRCCLIAASDADAIVAVFDPEQIEAGPVAIGICIRAGKTVRLEFGNLWMGPDGRAALIASDGYFTVENGRFVRRMGKPVRDTKRGIARARRRLANLMSVSAGKGVLVVSMG